MGKSESLTELVHEPIQDGILVQAPGRKILNLQTRVRFPVALPTFFSPSVYEGDRYVTFVTLRAFAAAVKLFNSTALTKHSISSRSRILPQGRLSKKR